MTSKIDDGGPAFPSREYESRYFSWGMSLRDYFAAQATEQDIDAFRVLVTADLSGRPEEPECPIEGSWGAVGGIPTLPEGDPRYEPLADYLRCRDEWQEEYGDWDRRNRAHKRVEARYLFADAMLARRLVAEELSS